MGGPMHGGRLFDLITRHFLAVCSDDAIGFETVVTLECATETFTCKGSQQQPHSTGTPGLLQITAHGSVVPDARVQGYRST